jgi:murein L,D-transpeptidase YcbB/YkuD
VNRPTALLFLWTWVLGFAPSAFASAAPDSGATPPQTGFAQTTNKAANFESPYLELILAGAPDSLGIYDTPESRRHWKILRSFYAERGYRPGWSDGRGGFPLAALLFSEIRHCADHGLDPFLYPVNPLEARIREAVAWDPRRWAEIDLSLSYLFVTYTAHLGRGRVDPRDLPEVEWYLPKRRVGLARVLAAALESGEIEKTLHAAAPQQPEYRRLVSGLHRLRDASVSGWPRIPNWKFKAEPGDTLSELSVVRFYLEAVGDLPPGPTRNPAVMDDILEAGVARFQGRHGLTTDGVIGPKTIAQMRVTAAQRVRTVILNLERWRWLPDTLAARHVMVNVPSYDLEVRDSARVVLAMRVIAGTKDTPTPSFQETIRHLEINPAWHVPESIASAEILPKVQVDPDYLLSENISVFDTLGKRVDPALVEWKSLDPGSLPYRFRQEPGAENPLGSIKFLFPNQWSVYLHDTPNTRLFNKDYRALSHGCIRIEKPLDMATYLLEGQALWTKDALVEFVKSGKRRWIDLKNPLPIYIVYFTAFAERDGALNFRPDIYGRDALLENAMRAYASPWTPPDTTAVAPVAIGP